MSSKLMELFYEVFELSRVLWIIGCFVEQLGWNHEHINMDRFIYTMLLETLCISSKNLSCKTFQINVYFSFVICIGGSEFPNIWLFNIQLTQLFSSLFKHAKIISSKSLVGKWFRQPPPCNWFQPRLLESL